MDGVQLLAFIRSEARKLGFSQIGIAPVDLRTAEAGLRAWLAAGFHGDMGYMAAHGMKRARPAELVPETASVISVSMDYLPRSVAQDWREAELARLRQPDAAVISLYARGRDYHKVLRPRLQRLADRMQQQLGPLGVRAFTDSAPVLEVELAARSGLGWRGRHTLALRRDAGSMFFLGELFVNRALPMTDPASDHCGTCQACVQVCPTRAIVPTQPEEDSGDKSVKLVPGSSESSTRPVPYTVDARRCISYLTIEHAGAIPVELRAAIGNHLYGCDDCQLVCPWNKFARPAVLADFDARADWSGMDGAQALSFSEAEFLRCTEGSPIRRIGHARWLRNAAVVAGNVLAVSSDAASRLRPLLAPLLQHPSDMVREHAAWALDQRPGPAPSVGPGAPGAVLDAGASGLIAAPAPQSAR